MELIHVKQQNEVDTAEANEPEGACGSAQRYSKGRQAQMVRKEEQAKTEVVSERP